MLTHARYTAPTECIKLDYGFVLIKNDEERMYFDGDH